MRRHKSPARLGSTALFLILFLSGLCCCCNAQGRATAEQGVRLQAYVLVTYVRPDYLGAVRNGGATAGVNVNVGRVAHLFDPSLDVRVLASRGNASNQTLFGFGPRVVFGVGRLQPYAEFLVGDGRITFAHPSDPNYTHDDCFAKVYGGGVDVRVSRDFAVRAEFLRQNWQLSTKTPEFHPQAASVGLRYQLHLRGRGGPDL